MQALKVLVVVMGVLIIVGFGVVVATIVHRIGNARSSSSVSNSSVGADAARPFPATAIDIPRGARIEAMAAGPDRLVLGLVLPEGDRRLVVIDLATGRELGAVALHAVP